MGIKMWAVTYPGRPTFYLCPHVSGIVSADHATRLAAKVLNARDAFYIDRISVAEVDLDDDPTIEAPPYGPPA